MSAFSSTINSSGSGTNHWHQLAVLLHHAPLMAAVLMHRPPPAIPSGKCIADIAASAQQYGLTELLEKHLFGGFLLTPRAQQDQWPLSPRDVAGRLFPGTDQELLQVAPWIHVPILAVQRKKGRAVSMMVGLLPDSTDCRAIGSPTPDARTAEAVCRACRIAGAGNGVIYWFLQQEDEQPVQGNSLALPVALAVEFLCRSASWPEGLYATGELEEDGSIVPVAHVREKYRCIAPSCRLFLAPADMTLPHSADQPVHGCTSFDDACFAATLYSGGTTAADISLYQACWISEHNFFNNFHELPQAMAKSPRAREFFRRAAAEPESHLHLLTGCFRRCRHDRRRGQYLAELFTPEKIENLTGNSPSLDFSAFNWCLAAVAFHNHCGQVRESRRWRSCADSLLSRVDLMEIGRFINHTFVGHRFNRYDFRPEATPELTAVLEQEEKKQEVYPGSNALLGALYGTLAQNFGFCGPSRLPSLLEMTYRARKAFGRKYLHETERLLNYEIYGYLDSGQPKQARQLTGKYLGLGDSCGPEDWLQQAETLLTAPDASGPFKAALVMRLLSEIGYKPSPAYITARISIICRQRGHPWQLIALNLGRMAAAAGRLEDAGQLFHHSLRICLADSDTMRPMGLLALGELYTTGLTDDDDYRKAQEINKWLKQTDRLNTDHFHAIFGLMDSKELLHGVNLERNRLFPFSYR